MSKPAEEYLKENCENFIDPVTWESSEYYKVSIDELQAYADKVKLEHTIKALEDLSKDFNAIKEDVDSFADEEELTLDLTIVKYKKQLKEIKK